jgi:hypothetical protein
MMTPSVFFVVADIPPPPPPPPNHAPQSHGLADVLPYALLAIVGSLVLWTLRSRRAALPEDASSVEKSDALPASGD